MDKFKQRNNDEMTSWDVGCKYVKMNDSRRRLKKKFRKMARKRLTNDLNSDIMKEVNE